MSAQEWEGVKLLPNGRVEIRGSHNLADGPSPRIAMMPLIGTVVPAGLFMLSMLGAQASWTPQAGNGWLVAEYWETNPVDDRLAWMVVLKPVGN